MLQVLITLRFYSAITFQVVTGDLASLSQPTVCSVVDRISRHPASTLFFDLGKFPAGATDFDGAMRDFSKIGNFAGVTGCTDCAAVQIEGHGSPNGDVYRNREGLRLR